MKFGESLHADPDLAKIVDAEPHLDEQIKRPIMHVIRNHLPVDPAVRRTSVQRVLRLAESLDRSADAKHPREPT